MSAQNEKEASDWQDNMQSGSALGSLVQLGLEKEFSIWSEPLQSLVVDKQHTVPSVREDHSPQEEHGPQVGSRLSRQRN